MANVLHGVSFTQPTNSSNFAITAFTPAANDLLGALVVGKGTVAAGSITDNQNLGWTKITSALFNTSADTYYAWIANTLAANSSITLTLDFTGDAVTSALVYVFRVSGMSKTGKAAVRQFAIAENKTASPISSPLFAFNCLSANPTIEGMGSGESGMTPPTNWTELADGNSGEYHSRNSGFSGTNIGWADTVITPYAIIALELDANRNISFVNNLRPAIFKPGLAR